ncbi:MAG: hypothetical protein NZM06_07930 [Chloroherpetonaceae bacterium]|nr:hypothetical protein [Chloroherpetonaceae bacterium]MDW8437677.1 hypothetical protein [Chloroherpetonaceae bacterium]
MCILAILFWLSLSLTGLAEAIDLRSVFWAWLICAANASVGYLLYEYAYHKGNQEFYKIVLGGHGVRALLTLSSVAWLVLASAVSREEFALTFFALYFAHLILEVLAYLKKNQFEKRSSSNGASSTFANR